MFCSCELSLKINCFQVKLIKNKEVVKIRLTKNEKKTLKLLIDNGRISDTDIAEYLKVTKQAVGKIRRKLEDNGIIMRYSAELDYHKLGISVFALANVISNPRCGKDDQSCQQHFAKNPFVIKMCKLPEQNRFSVFYGFRDLMEMENYLKDSMLKDTPTSHNTCFSQSSLKIFPGCNILKNNTQDLLSKVIDEI